MKSCVNRVMNLYDAMAVTMRHASDQTSIFSVSWDVAGNGWVVKAADQIMSYAYASEDDVEDGRFPEILFVTLYETPVDEIIDRPEFERAIAPAIEMQVQYFPYND